MRLGSKAAPADAELERLKAPDAEFLLGLPLQLPVNLKAPDDSERLRAKSMARPDRAAGFGRTLTAFAGSGRFDAAAGIEALRLRSISSGATRLRVGLVFSDEAVYKVTAYRPGEAPRAVSLVRLPETGRPENPLWTPMTEGDEQEIVVQRLSADGNPWSVAIARLSHIEGTIAGARVTQPGIGYNTSAACEVDLYCLYQVTPPAAQPALFNAVEAVALLAMTDAAGITEFCTGTLLNSASYPAPLLYTAEHCAHDAASIASLVTVWFYQRDACDAGPPSTRTTQVAGGAVAVFVSRELDSALLLLNNAPPAEARYSAWDASVIPDETDVLGMHHPKADLKKGSVGSMPGLNATPIFVPGRTFPPGSFYQVVWQVGLTEQGSSGSGLFTYDAGFDAVVTRGTLTAIGGACNTPSRAYYSPLAFAYPFISSVLSGKAVAPGRLQVPSPVTFPVQAVGTQSAPIDVTITNVGASAVAISNVLATDVAEFPGTTDCVGHLAAGASCRISMSFRPASAGLRMQTVTVVSDGEGSPQAFQVSGTGSAGTNTFVPVPGVWWSKTEPGSGFGFDYKDGTLVVELYSYLVGGASQWYLAAGPLTNNVFTATLDKYVNGQCVSCPYKAPALAGNDGTITITFTSPTGATVDLPGGRHIQIERYFQATPAAGPTIPVPGIWWNKDEPGSGFGLDYANGMLIAEIYSYLANGAAQWYLAAGPLTNSVFTATLDKYVNGQCVSCTYASPSLAGNDGLVTITFTSPTTATADLPGRARIRIERYFTP